MVTQIQYVCRTGYRKIRNTLRDRFHNVSQIMMIILLFVIGRTVINHSPVEALTRVLLRDLI